MATKATEEKEKIEDVKLDAKVVVRSIAPWNTGSARKMTSGDISISPLGSVMVSREELIAQAQNGNVLLTGIDDLGSHATWYIEDDFTRKELSFEMNGKKQEFLSVDEIKRIFDLKTQKSFEENIIKSVVTRAEKFYLLNQIKALKLNDYEKIAFCEKYCGRRVSEV